MKYSPIIISLLFLLSLISYSQDAYLLKLSGQVQALEKDPHLVQGQFAFSLYSPSEKKQLYGLNENKSLIPASNLKTLTTAAALGILGKDFTFKTTIEYDGVLGADGSLNGNLYIRGGGDPTLGSDRYSGLPGMSNLLEIFYEKIKAAGIKKISGAVIGDAAIFGKNTLPDTWIWADIGNYFGAGAAGLNLNENMYRLYFTPGKKAQDPAAILRTEPEVPGLTFENEVRTGPEGSGDKACIYGSPFSSIRYVNGTIPLGPKSFSIKGTLPDPAYFSAWHLDRLLNEKGIATGLPPGAVYEKSSSSRTLVYIHNSPALAEIAAQTNIFSINLYAEAMLKMVGHHLSGEGSTVAGVMAVKNYWKDKGINTEGMILYDGSGLSLANVITAAQLAGMMGLIKEEPYYQVFYNSLPVAGVSGTVSRICKGSSAENKIRVKSGSLQKVVCYTGYVETRTKGTLAFSMMANNFECSSYEIVRKMEKLMIIMAEL